MSLTSADLSKVVAATIQSWRETEESLDAASALTLGCTLGTPRDNAPLLAELAEMTLHAHGRGQSLHDHDCVSA